MITHPLRLPEPPRHPADSLAQWPGVFVSQDGRLRLPARWGRFTVPLRRDVADARAIEIGFVRVACRGNPVSPPIVVLAGGPGGSGVRDLQREPEVLEALLEVGDVIGLDQRGVGLSRPRLLAPSTRPVPLTEPLTREMLIAAYRQHAACAHAFWHEAGVDLAGFNTRESAADVDDLRRALGLEQICISGDSYGSHLGLAVLKAHGDGIARAVLGLVEGPDDTWKLPSNVDRFFVGVSARLQAEGWGGGRLPDLVTMMREVHERLHDRPIPIGHLTGEGRPQWLSETLLQVIASFALGDTSALAALPALYADLWQGRVDSVAPLAAHWDGHVDDCAMSMAMDSASGGTAARRARVEVERHGSLLGDVMNLPYPHIDAEIGALDLGDEFRAPVCSDVPTLLLTGGLDGRTPESNARAVQVGLPCASHVLLHGCGHHLDPRSGHLDDVRAFLRGQEVVDRGTRLVPVHFAPPA